MTEVEKSELAEAIAEKVAVKVIESIQEVMKSNAKGTEKEDTEKYKDLVKRSLS